MALRGDEADTVRQISAAQRGGGGDASETEQDSAASEMVEGGDEAEGSLRCSRGSTEALPALRGGGDAALDVDGQADGASAAAHGRNATLLARLHPLPGDAHLTFDEPSHTYTVWGAPVARSVTALVGALFEAFDPERCIARRLYQVRRRA